MAQTDTLKQVSKLIDLGLIKETDLAIFANEKLASAGLSLAGANAARKARPGKKEATEPQKRTVKREAYADGRANKHAILYAINEFGEEGCDSGALRAKLAEIGHEMETNPFQSTRSAMQNKEKLIKSTGKIRERVYKLTVAGKAELEAYENPEVEDEAEAEEEPTEE